MVIALFLLVAVALVVAAVRLRSRELLPPADPSEVRRLATAGQKIDAIRMYRQITGVGLYDANQAIEAIKLYREKHGVDLLTAKNAVEKLARS